MKLWKKLIIYGALISLLQTSFVDSTQILEAQNDIQEKLAVPDSFKWFLELIIEKAKLHNKTDLLSDGLLRSYERIIIQGKSTLYVRDLVEAYAELVEELVLLDASKAPRLDAPGSNGSIVGSLVDCNLNPVILRINELINLVTQCCAELTADFNETFTIFNKLEQEIIGTQTSIDSCCAFISNEFNGTFTVLDTFHGTFTVLEVIELSVLACKASIITTPTTISASGSYCLSNNITGTITIQSDNVYLTLGGNTISDGALIINASKGVNVSGGIIDASASLGAIQVINSSNVTLSSFTLINPANDGIRCDNVTSLLVKNFAIRGSGNNGISFINNPSTAVILQNFDILNTTSNAVYFNTNISDITIKTGFMLTSQGIRQEASSTISRMSFYNLTVNSVTNNTNYSFAFLGTVLDLTFNNMVLSNVIGGIEFASLTNAFLKNCTIKEIAPSSISGTVLDGFRIDTGEAIQFESCSIENINSGTNIIFFNGFSINSVNTVILRCCNVQNISRNTAMLNGYFFGNSNNIQLIKCTAQEINSVDLTQVAAGYNFSNSTKVFLNSCAATACSSFGFELQAGSDFFVFNNCYALFNNVITSGAKGFQIPAVVPLHISMQLCQSSFNDGNGFDGGSGVVIGHSVAQGNGGIGYNGNADMLVYDSYAVLNTTTNYLNLNPLSPVQLIGTTTFMLGANISD